MERSVPSQGDFAKLAENYQSGYAALPLEQRKTWYSKTAAAYSQTRPRYPQALIDRAIEVAQLSANAAILEIGCGPGIATVPFAQRGFSIMGLDPSQEACHLAQQNCAAYQTVEIQNTTFEEWELEPERFDVVLAATSFHWVAPEVGYSKAAAALKNRGSLMLLWNTAPQPSREICQALSQVYSLHAPTMGRYEDQTTQAETLEKFGQAAVNSGDFHSLVSHQIESHLTYTIAHYLALLSTLSPYIALDSQKRIALFTDLEKALEETCGETIQTAYLSVLHLAQKT